MDDSVTTEELEEALSLLHGESVSIEPARKKVVRRGGKMVQTEEPAYVKFYTDFKDELVNISGNTLKVFIFIGLSIGWETGSAYPGVRKIAKKTGLDKDTVSRSVAELESMGFLEIVKREGNSNVYTPVGYFAIGKTVPTVGTVDEELSEESDELSPSEAELSPRGRVNLHNQINKIKEELEQKMSIENLVYLDRQVTQASQEREALKNVAPKQFENALGFSKPLPWWKDKEWTEFAEWVCDRYLENKMCFGEYNIWRNTPFTKGGISNTRLRGFPVEFYDSWDMFVMSKPKPAEQPKREEGRGFYA